MSCATNICLSLATVPKRNVTRWKGVYNDVCQTPEVTVQGPRELMRQAGGNTPFSTATLHKPQSPF